jgi:hypothetical protein
MRVLNRQERLTLNPVQPYLLAKNSNGVKDVYPKKNYWSIIFSCTVMFGNIDRGIAVASVYTETKGRKDSPFYRSNSIYIPELSCSF